MAPFGGLLDRAKSSTTTTRIGQAMIETAGSPPAKRVLEPPDINALANARGGRRRG